VSAISSRVPESGASATLRDAFLSDEAIFCTVTYQSHTVFAKGSRGDWLQSGIVGQNFHQTILLSTNEASNDRYRNARDESISKGLVEMGRRKLDVPIDGEKEIVAVPRFSGWPGKNLSSETYLRLTVKGILVAEESLPSEQLEKTREVDARSKEQSRECNLYLRNLPLTVRIEDLVHFLENKFRVDILRACVSSVHTKADFSCAHIEFRNKENASEILQVAEGIGLLYGDRSIYVVPDQNVPNWAECIPTSLYESSNKYFKSIASQEASDAARADSKHEETQVAASEESKHEETLKTTDLLFGDNLALLYAQSQSFAGNSNLGRTIWNDINEPSKTLQALALSPTSPAQQTSAWNGAANAIDSADSETLQALALNTSAPAQECSAWNGAVTADSETLQTSTLSTPSPAREGFSDWSGIADAVDISDSETVPMVALSTLSLTQEEGRSAWKGVAGAVDIADSEIVPTVALSTPPPAQKECSGWKGTADVVADIADSETVSTVPLSTPSPAHDGYLSWNDTSDVVEQMDFDETVLALSIPSRKGFSALNGTEQSDSETAALTSPSPTENDGQPPSSEIADFLW